MKIIEVVLAIWCVFVLFSFLSFVVPKINKLNSETMILYEIIYSIRQGELDE